MARPLSEDKRSALLAAATEAVAELGLAASTARIAEMAGVGSGTLFVYFPTKDDLFCQLYVELRNDLSATVVADFPTDQSVENRFAHIWNGMINWGLANPAKQKVLDTLGVSEKFQSVKRAAESEDCDEISALFDEGYEAGVLREQPAAFVVDMLQTLAAMVLDRCRRSPEKRALYQQLGWEALWGALSKHNI